MCQKDGRKGVVVAYATKNLSKSQKNYHLMDGECYTLIWAVMHFRHIHIILSMDHKPLEWLLTVLDAHGRKGH